MRFFQRRGRDSNQRTSNVGSTTATAGGHVSADGGFPITNRGICYSTTPDPTIASLHTNDGLGLGSFVSQMAGLSTHTTYYVRAYATNSAGTVYGEQRTFVKLSTFLTMYLTE